MAKLVDGETGGEPLAELAASVDYGFSFGSVESYWFVSGVLHPIS